MDLPPSSARRPPAAALGSIAVALLALAAGAIAAPSSAAAARWEKLTRQSPCEWLPADVVAGIVGPEAKGQLRTTKADTGCSWRTPRGNPVLTATVAKWTSAANMVAERDELLRQIAQYGGDRFTRLPAPGGATTIVMRKDRGRVTLFPTGSTSVTVITVNPHLVMKESDAEKDARRARAVAYTEALVKRHGL